MLTYVVSITNVLEYQLRSKRQRQQNKLWGTFLGKLNLTLGYIKQTNKKMAWPLHCGGIRVVEVMV